MNALNSHLKMRERLFGKGASTVTNIRGFFRVGRAPQTQEPAKNRILYCIRLMCGSIPAESVIDLTTEWLVRVTQASLLAHKKRG